MGNICCAHEDLQQQANNTLLDDTDIMDNIDKAFVMKIRNTLEPFKYDRPPDGIARI